MMATSAPLTTISVNLNQSCDVFIYQEVAHIIFPIFYTVVFFISLLGNSLVLLIMCQRHQKLNATSIYLMNLAVSDALFTLALPGRITYYVRKFDWPFGDVLCRITAVLFYSNTYAGIAFMTCISLDRYLAMVHPHRAQGLRKVQTARRVSCLVWAIVILETGPLLLQKMVLESQDRQTCMEYFNLQKSRALPYLLLLACMVGFCFPLGLILFCYSRIRLKLSRTARLNPVVDRSGRSGRAKSIILVILATFLVCFSPYHITIMQFMVRNLLADPTCDDRKGFKMALQVTVSLMNLNCCLDPLIYFFAIKTYKRRVVSFFKLRLSTTGAATTNTKSLQENSSSNT
ncbi:G-protein coupled receptor 183 [Alosa sapidissima]|uniref:G-protein coupled receptor 183 n=1 Tax=Alosa sapidissima TaxID=34773 RepID=UPI001C08AA44|nr:G-protein coupled receptor 183 [Alosa sapidissima]